MSGSGCCRCGIMGVVLGVRCWVCDYGCRVMCGCRCVVLGVLFWVLQVCASGCVSGCGVM